MLKALEKRLGKVEKTVESRINTFLRSRSVSNGGRSLGN